MGRGPHFTSRMRPRDCSTTRSVQERGGGEGGYEFGGGVEEGGGVGGAADGGVFDEGRDLGDGDTRGLIRSWARAARMLARSPRFAPKGDVGRRGHGGNVKGQMSKVKCGEAGASSRACRWDLGTEVPQAFKFTLRWGGTIIVTPLWKHRFTSANVATSCRSCGNWAWTPSAAGPADVTPLATIKAQHRPEMGRRRRPGREGRRPRHAQAGLREAQLS